jgi:hypothetical protein
MKFLLPAFTPKDGSQERPIYPWSSPWQMRFSRYAMAPVGFISSHSVTRVEPGAFIQGLQNLMGKLPHDL